MISKIFRNIYRKIDYELDINNKIESIIDNVGRDIEDKVEHFFSKLERNQNLNRFVSKVDNALDKIEHNPFLNKMIYAHPYDNSDLNDLISDHLSIRKINPVELCIRKFKYSYKTIIFLLL